MSSSSCAPPRRTRFLPTIQSRCQRFEFRRPHAGMVLKCSRRSAAAEEIEIDEAGLAAIAAVRPEPPRRHRALDQLATYCDRKIAMPMCSRCWARWSRSWLFESGRYRRRQRFARRSALREPPGRPGKDFGQFAQELIGHLRNIFLLQQLDDYPPGIITAADEDVTRLKGQSRLLAPGPGR